MDMDGSRSAGAVSDDKFSNLNRKMKEAQFTRKCHCWYMTGRKTGGSVSVVKFGFFPIAGEKFRKT